MKNPWILIAIGISVFALNACDKESTPTVKLISASIEPYDYYHGKVTVVGEVISDGGAFVSSRGVVWSQYPDPRTISDNEGMTTTGAGTGQFTTTFLVRRGWRQDHTGVSRSPRRYMVRVYAINSVGVAYGERETSVTTEQW